MNQSDVSAYLARIRYDGPTEPTLDTLRGLHMAHLLSVPFENLDIHLDRKIVLEPGRLFAKIVGARRGGFCYELNGLFADLLASLGFDVSMMAARVWGSPGNGVQGGYGVELAHMTLLVRLGEPVLADVGFGEGFREPLRLVDGLEQPQGLGKAYRLAREGDEWRYDAREARDAGGEWVAQYRFSPKPLALEEFQPGCDYQQFSPESHFKQGRLCSLARPDGRITLRDERLIVTRDGVKEESPIEGEEQFRAALRENFRVELA
jgi:N-hydroxyarylamine O-acetyltransferase